jgi:hypothetical protein
MALTVSQLFTPTQLAAAPTAPAVPAVLFSMPDATSQPGAVLKNGRVRLTNTSSAAVPVTLYAAAAAAASSAANCCMSAQSIQANSYIDIDIPTLKAGDTLRGFAGTASVITIHEMGGVLYS